MSLGQTTSQSLEKAESGIDRAFGEFHFGKDSEHFSLPSESSVANVLPWVAHETPENAKARALIQRMTAGDEEALGELYVLYQKPLAAISVRILGRENLHEVEEVLQDAFLRAWKHASRFDPERAAPFGWLVTITRRLCLDRARKSNRRPVLVTEFREHSPEVADPTDASPNFPLDPLQTNDVQSSLKSLPARQRLALEMAYFQGLTQQEIATRTKRPLGSIKSDIRRALIFLRQHLRNRESS